MNSFFDETISVRVNYSLTFVEAMATWCEFSDAKGITDEHFPVTERGMVSEDIVLARFSKGMSLSDILKEFDHRGLRPANLRELLAIGAQHRDLLEEFPIVALGAMGKDSDGNDGAVYLITTFSTNFIGMLPIPCIGSNGRERYAAVAKR